MKSAMTIPSERIEVLIVSPASRFRDGLQAVVQAFPFVATINTVDKFPPVFPAALDLNSPVLLLDAVCLTAVPLAELRAWHQTFPELHCIVIVDREQQRELGRALEADAILLRGFPTETLKQAMAALVAREKALP